MDAIVSGLVNLGVGGVMAAALVWFLYWIVTKTLPQMTQQFGQELKEKRETYLTELRAERQAFAEELRAERDIRVHAVELITGAVRELQKEMANEHNALMAQNRELHERLLDRIAQGSEQLVQEVTENRALMQGMNREPRRKVARKTDEPATGGGEGQPKPG